jgi:phosphate transport system permease protein
MIVLMATGNTPVLDLSMFQGMRTLSANIAVEMPESELNSTHYRVLFLAGLVLFLFTFMFNTMAEVIRQRLRTKYSSL